MVRESLNSEDGPSQLVGKATFPIERSKLAELASAIGEVDPVWFDSYAADAAGFGEIPVPMTVTVLADHWRNGGALEIAKNIGFDVERLLHGEVTWTWVSPVKVGDTLTAVSRLTKKFDKARARGGRLTFAIIETEVTTHRGDLAIVKRDTLIERSA